MVKVDSNFTIIVDGKNFKNEYDAYLTRYNPGIRVLKEKYIDRNSLSGYIDNCETLGRPEFGNRVSYFSFAILGDSGSTHKKIRQIKNNHCESRQNIEVSDGYTMKNAFIGIVDINIKKSVAEFTLVCTSYSDWQDRGNPMSGIMYDIARDGLYMSIDGFDIGSVFGMSVLSITPIEYVRKESNIDIVFREYPYNDYIESVSGDTYIDTQISPKKPFNISFNAVYKYTNDYNFGTNDTGVEKFVQYINGFVSTIDIPGIGLSVNARMKAAYVEHTPKYSIVNVIATVSNPNNIYTIFRETIKEFPSSISKTTGYLNQQIIISTNTKLLVTFTNRDTGQSNTVSISGENNKINGLRPSNDGSFTISFSIDNTGLRGITYGELEYYTFGEIGSLHKIGEWESGSYVLASNPYVIVEWKDLA